MTVSHLFFNNSITEASINYEEYKNNPNIRLPYDINDQGFKDLVQSIALGTKATFSFNPTLDEIKAYLA